VNLRELVRFEIEGLSVQLPPHKRILTYDISLEPLPRTTTGKIRRHEVERRALEQAAEPAAADRPLTEAEAAWTAAPEQAALIRAIARRLDRATVPPDANLELDLGLDSMERVELLTTLERLEGTQVAADGRPTNFPVRQLVDAVRAAPACRPGSSATDDSDLPWEVVLAEAPDAALVESLRRPKLVRAVLLFAMVRALALPARLLLRFRTRGRASLPASGPCIISPNHQTYLDGFFVTSQLPFRLFRRMFLVGASEYFETPFMAWLARAINVVPVDPNANLVTAMRAGAAGLRLGRVLILFPEGERSIDGELKPFRKGAAILSAHLDAPIVPVALDGLFPLWPRGRRFNWRALRPGATRVSMAFGAPVRSERGRYDEGTAALRAAVSRMVHALRH
jgi:long-chain acyl-CoA synthetase